MTLPDWKDIAGIFPSTAPPPPTMLVAGFCLLVIVGALLAYRRHRAKQSSYADIETSAEISFLGQQDNFWIVELKAILNNKGKAQRKIHKFRFDLHAIDADDPIEASKKSGGRVNFANEIAKGSFVPRGYAYCVVGPSVKATYCYVARVPESATFLILHCRFDYNPSFSHSMEKAVQVPRSTALLDQRDDDAQFAGSSLQPGRSPGADAPADKAFATQRWAEARELRDA
jgi:hypothetical protein